MKLKFIWAALIICLSYVLIHQILLQIPAKERWHQDLGLLFQALSLSYIAAFLFYIVHDYFPYLKAKKKYQPVIDRELSDLWEICNGFTYMIRHHSQVSVYNVSPPDFKSTVPKQFQSLPVHLNKVEDIRSTNNKQKNFIPPADTEFDEKSKPLIIREISFDKWSEAIDYVSLNINNTLNKVLQLKEVVDEETILKIFDLEKSINDFRIVAHIYEENNYKTFKNEYLEQKFIKFYEGTEELKKYKNSYKDPRKNNV